MTQSFAMVLSDELQKVYLDFKEKHDFDQDIVTKLFKYFKGPFATNTAQLSRIDKKPSPAIEQQLRASGFTTQPLEELAAGKTIYKIILSKDKNTFPYVNINGDQIENNLSGCFFRGKTREKAIQHIKTLCRKAEDICLYDKYITRRGSERDNQELLRLIGSLFPGKKMNIVYQNGHLEDTDVNFLNTICSKWTFEKKMNIPDHHDRYLIIDNKMEIILTGGFSTLMDTTKEFTYIVRPVDDNRFLNYP